MDFSMKVAKLLQCPSSRTVEQFSVKVDHDIKDLLAKACSLFSAVSAYGANLAAVKSLHCTAAFLKSEI